MGIHPTLQGGLGKAAELRPSPEPVRSCISGTEEGSRESMEVVWCSGSAQLDVCFRLLRAFHCWMTAPARRTVVRVAAPREGALILVPVAAGLG